MNIVKVVEKYGFKFLTYSLITIMSLAVFAAMVKTLPPAVDWNGAFRPAALKLLAVKSPYEAEGFFNPPWTALFLLPFAIFPESVGRAFLLIAALISYSFTAHKLGATKLTIIILLLSPPVIHGILNGNIDWLPVLGFVLPPWIGLFFLTIKPQIGGAVIIYIIYSTWKEGGVKKTLSTFTPLFIVSVVSVLLFGPWFLAFRNEVNLSANASLWPMSLPIGISLLVAALHRTEIRFSIAASPFLSPYVIFHSWVGVLIALTSNAPEMIAAVIGLWILVASRILYFF